jgi:hypothetical protein
LPIAPVLLCALQLCLPFWFEYFLHLMNKTTMIAIRIRVIIAPIDIRISRWAPSSTVMCPLCPFSVIGFGLILVGMPWKAM